MVEIFNRLGKLTSTLHISGIIRASIVTLVTCTLHRLWYIGIAVLWTSVALLITKLYFVVTYFACCNKREIQISDVKMQATNVWLFNDNCGYCSAMAGEQGTVVPTSLSQYNHFTLGCPYSCFPSMSLQYIHLTPSYQPLNSYVFPIPNSGHYLLFIN